MALQMLITLLYFLHAAILCCSVQVVGWRIPSGSFGRLLLRCLALHEAAGHASDVAHAVSSCSTVAAWMGAQVVGRAGQMVADRCLCDGKKCRL